MVIGMTSKRSSAAHYKGVAVAMLPVVRRVVADKQLREDFRHVIKSGQRVTGHMQGEGAGKKARLLITDPDVSVQLGDFMDALEDATKRLRHATVEEPRHWGRWLLVGGAGVAGVTYLFGGRSGVRDRVVSLARPGARDTETITT
jgi:hypothetical protein